MLHQPGPHCEAQAQKNKTWGRQSCLIQDSYKNHTRNCSPSFLIIQALFTRLFRKQSAEARQRFTSHRGPCSASSHVVPKCRVETAGSWGKVLFLKLQPQQSITWRTWWNSGFGNFTFLKSLCNYYPAGPGKMCSAEEPGRALVVNRDV